MTAYTHTEFSAFRRERKTRIVATLGPASSSHERIKALFEAGVDVFRLNMSHGDHAGKEDLVKIIRSVEEEVGRPIAILADLQGPKLRCGTFADGKVLLEEGQRFTLDLTDVPGTKERVGLPHKEIFDAIEVGTNILLDDGKIRLEVTEIEDGKAHTAVLVGGYLSDRKGVNVPNAVLPLAALTEKDRADLAFALKAGADWIALSFVQRSADVAEAKKLVGGKAAVMAKIEKPAAVDALDEIIELSDGVMVARGDLGVEEPVEKVPGIQKKIIRKARHAGKPVVVATQMLESMIQSPVPTRAEVTDVATAVADGADAVMLSAESAVGDFPCEAVAVMDRVAKRVEAEPDYMATGQELANANSRTEDAITAAARQVTKSIGAEAIVTFTTSGATAIRASRERPSAPILTLTPSTPIARRMAIVWGLHTVKTKDVDSFEEMIGKAKRMALRSNLAKAGDRIVVTAGVPFGTPGATNVLHIAWVDGSEV
ncbi:pyruvate kinase [Kordiimonas laminariae]|uniref:pyruvate kinase n=1 Tax=Kordiimonas laminariae TaxID=2917717 RepID=UPI001FF18980|nr:pyruvate kinase [Kordiimonas laminariae]MCK0068370.1 pyruvate kinase [Kordiimonas laminariae]